MATNAGHIVGSWIRGEQEGAVGSWLSTMKETWKFNVDLTYEHTTERYEGGITTGPFFQSSYSRPTGSVQRGIWAPPDWIRDQLDLFVMSSEGFARQMKLEWVDNTNDDYRAIDCGRAIQVPERQSTFHRRATRRSSDYSKPFAVRICSVRAARSPSAGVPSALQFAFADWRWSPPALHQ